MKRDVVYMENRAPRTSEAQRKAVREYEKRNDRINIIFPGGTKKRMKELGIEKPNTFIKEAVSAELDRMEKYSSGKGL
jgi:hypothetical protein